MMYRILLLTSCLFTLVAEYPAWNDKLNHTDIEERLQSEKIVHSECFKNYLRKEGTRRGLPDNQVQLITLESGLKGVFKQGAHCFFAEVAGYRASKQLGLRLVPPTVLRTIKGALGSLQCYVPAKNLKSKRFRKRIFKKLDAKTVSDMRIFYFVFGQWDNHGGNQVAFFDNDNLFLALIDNAGLICGVQQTYGKPVFLSLGENRKIPSQTGTRFPYDQVKTAPGSHVASLFKPYLSSKDINKFRKDRAFRYVIWNHRLYKEMPQRMKNYTGTIYRSTLQALKKLDYQTVHSFWREFSEISPGHVQELIELTLDKRDQVVSFFESSGTIHPN